ncbi:MAG: hypothetical protein Q4P15_14060, partial [Propionibacteriaceae bacterium]|nr:hypothetical protein [Propionibacteriaceae bacterium]
MNNRELLMRALTVVKMVLRVTPFSAAVDLAQDAAAFNVPKDLEGLFTSARATRAAVARTFSDIDAADRSASDGQLITMLDACDEEMVLSHALHGASALEAWLLDEQLVRIPPFLGQAETYFRDQLTLFCHLAAHAALDPRRPYTHVVLAVARHGSRLEQIASAVADIQDELTLIKAQILAVDFIPEVSISRDDWIE